MKKNLYTRENILVVIPFLFCLYIYFFKNDNPQWVLTFQGVSESLESALGFCFIWWVIFLGTYFLHVALRRKNIASLSRWIHIILSISFVFIFYWLFFEKVGIIPGWHTTVIPFNFEFGNVKIPVFTFMVIAGTIVQLFFIFYFLNWNK